MAGKLSEHWQDGKTLKECNLHLMENEFSDITFRLHYKGESKQEEVADIPALRLLCLARSSVFFDMFAGQLTQQLEDRVFDIHDDHADPHAFKQMIRFMYSDDVVLTAENVLAVLYLSQKYMVSTLTKRCLQFLEKALTPNTALLLLAQSILYREKELKAKTLTIIKNEAPAVLASDEFITVSENALGEILKLDLKVPKEVTVFEACIKWAKNQCQMLKKSPSGENIREVLGNNLYLIRFPTMSASEFTESVSPQDVLSSKEGHQVLRYITSETEESENLPFPKDQRLKIDPSSPRSLVISAPYLEISGTLLGKDAHSKVTSLSCTISKPLCLRMIHVHAIKSGVLIRQELTVTLKQNGECLHQKTGSHFIFTGQLPPHYSVVVGDVRVEPGAMEIILELKLSGHSNYTINRSSLETSKLSDDYVTITFPPVDENLLLGMEYCIP